MKTKKILSLLLVICIMMGSLFIAPVKVKASTHNFVTVERLKTAPAYTTANSYQAPNCTWYVWGRMYEKTGVKLPSAGRWGDAGSWYNNAPTQYKSQKLQENCIIVIGANQYSSLGHVIFVEKIVGNKVYISESNATSGEYAGYREEEKTISQCTMGNNYYANGGKVLGYIVPGNGGISQPSTTYANISGKYYLKNLNNNKYLTVDGFADADKANISTAAKTSEKQVITITNVGGNNHKIIPACTSRLVNAWGNNPTNGSNVNLYHYDAANASSQFWKFEKYGNGYIIHLAYDENLCLANSGTNVVVQNRTGYSHQVWSLEPITHTHDYKYQYFLASHPHYDQYRCTCGEYKRDYNSAKYYDICAECKKQNIQEGWYSLRTAQNDKYTTGVDMGGSFENQMKDGQNVRLWEYVQRYRRRKGLFKICR